MNEKEYRQDIEAQIDELNGKINSLKYQVVEPSLKAEFQKLIEELEAIKKRVDKTYKSADEVEEENWDTLRTNIYTDIKSFNNAFTEAGRMFNPRR
jgi:uncharacterized coiled-coil DUF342 family protein